MNNQVKFDLSEVDHDHREWLDFEAERRKMTVNELLNAVRLNKTSLEPRLEDRDKDDDDLCGSVTVTLDFADPRLLMALKRLAGKDGMTPEEKAGRILAEGIILDEASDNYEVDVLTGLIVD